MPETKAICLDLAYSYAFTNLALQSGYAKSLLDAHYLPVSDTFLDKRATGRLRRQALEMAVIFEKLYLFGPGDYIDFSPLKREGFSHEVIGGLSTFSDEIPITPDFLQVIKPNIIRSVHRKINNKMKYSQTRAVSYAEVSQKYDSLMDLAQTEYSLHELANNVIQTVSVLTNDKISKRDKRNILSAKERNLDPMKQAITYKVIATFEGFTIFTSIYEEVNTLWNNLLVSLSLEIPFATNKILELASPPKFLEANQHETYLMCQIVLKDEIGYAPVIESISDVLRLRENKYVSNFRETLWRWSKTLKHGEKRDIEKIKREIRLANKDLRLLKKWQYADNWIFWAEIAASLVPMLNYAVVGESIVRRLFVNKLESRSGWLAFIRE